MQQTLKTEEHNSSRPDIRIWKSNPVKIRIKWGNIFTSIAILVVVVLSILLSVSFMNRPEQYSTTLRLALLNELNNGDKDAIAYYDSQYVQTDMYLFDGPLTIELMAKKYSLDFSPLYDAYILYGNNNAQYFFKHYVKHLIALKTYS